MLPCGARPAVSGLCKPTVSVALAGRRAGRAWCARPGSASGGPAASALLYEVRPEAGFILGLDVGAQYVRGALADLAGGIRARIYQFRSRASSVRGRVNELIGLAGELCARAGISRGDVTQTVIGSPGVYDPRRNAMALTGGLPGWDRPAVLARLREAFGPGAERWRTTWTWPRWPSGPTGQAVTLTASPSYRWAPGIGMGLVLGGQLVRGAHGVAGEIAYMPMSGGGGTDPGDARRRGALEASASASAVVRAARRAGMRGRSRPAGVHRGRQGR